LKIEKDKIGPTAQRMKENQKKQEITEMAAHHAWRTLTQPPDIPTTGTTEAPAKLQAVGEKSGGAAWLVQGGTRPLRCAEG